MSTGMSLDVSIETELKLQFWLIFSQTLGLSATTGYDWTHTSESTKNEQITITVEADAPPGQSQMFH